MQILVGNGPYIEDFRLSTAVLQTLIKGLHLFKHQHTLRVHSVIHLSNSVTELSWHFIQQNAVTMPKLHSFTFMIAVSCHVMPHTSTAPLYATDSL